MFLTSVTLGHDEQKVTLSYATYRGAAVIVAKSAFTWKGTAIPDRFRIHAGMVTSKDELHRQMTRSFCKTVFAMLTGDYPSVHDNNDNNTLLDLNVYITKLCG